MFLYDYNLFIQNPPYMYTELMIFLTDIDETSRYRNGSKSIKKYIFTHNMTVLLQSMVGIFANWLYL